MTAAVQQPEYLTLEEAAAELDISVAGVRKAIQRGTLKALRRSPRRTIITRPAIEAYRTRAVRPDVSVTTVAALREAFERDVGMSARAWQERWRAGDIAESVESFRLGATSMTILAVEAEIAAENAAGVGPGDAPRTPGRPRRAAVRSRSPMLAREA